MWLKCKSVLYSNPCNEGMFMYPGWGSFISWRRIETQISAIQIKLTWNPITASKSPTAFVTSSHMSRKAFCKNCCTGTAFPCLSSIKSFGAKMSPPQKRVLCKAYKTHRRSKILTGLTTWLQLPTSYIHTATIPSLPRRGHHHADHAATQPQCPQ